MKNLIPLLVICLLHQSCATMFSGKDERIHLQSQVKGTQFYVKDRLIGTDHTTLIIPKNELKGTRIMATKAGCKDEFVDVKTEFNESTLLGLFIDFGLITILAVDWWTYGSTREATQTLYTMNPDCSNSTMDTIVHR